MADSNTERGEGLSFCHLCKQTIYNSKKHLQNFFLVTCNFIQMPQHCHKEIVYKLTTSEKTEETNVQKRQKRNL